MPEAVASRSLAVPPRRRAIATAVALLATLLAVGTAPPAGATHGFEIIRTVAGGGTLEGDAADGRPATEAALNSPSKIVVDGVGNYYFTEANRVRRVDANGIITTVAGTGEPGCDGDGGPATAAQVGAPAGLAFDAAGNLYVSQRSNSPDSCENRIRRIAAGADGQVTGAPDETITTIAGSTLGCSGEGGPAVSAQLRPDGMAFDSAGNLYIADGGCGQVVRVDTSGTLTTVAGINDSNFSGDGGPATEAAFNSPRDVHVDSAGNLFIVDENNHRIRKVVPGADGQVTGAPDEIITTVVGSGQGFGGDGAPATQALLQNPSAFDFDSAGNLYIADTRNNRVRRVVPGADGEITGAPDEIITTIAGGGTPPTGWATTAHPPRPGWARRRAWQRPIRRWACSSPTPATIGSVRSSRFQICWP